jgi:hypothetical protein
MGRWVDKEHFCTFVYNSEGQHLVKSYDEFSRLIATGAWFASKEDIPAAKEAFKPEIVVASDNIADDNIVPIKRKRGRKCPSPSNR